MKQEEAEKLLEKIDNYETDESEDKFFDGLIILKKYDKSIEYSAQHDIIYFNEFKEEMTKEDILKLHSLGFHIDEGSWVKFT